MSLLGIDVGTTGVKVALFTEQGLMLASAYREHQDHRPQPGYAELDASEVWLGVKSAIREVTAACPHSSIQALSVSSMGEAVVPVTANRQILAPSILNFDIRGAEETIELAPLFENKALYAINGNTFGNHYSLTKLKWIQRHQPELYARTYKFLHWSGFISFMLGAEAAVDYSLANRTLLFDLAQCCWSAELLQRAAIDGDKLPDPVPSGTVIGTVSAELAAELGLPSGVKIISGAHDQCANAIGCGVIDSGNAVYGMGTYLCITPVFSQRKSAEVMLPRGLNTEHHAVPDRFVSFLYNQGGALVKWFRGVFAAAEHAAALANGRDVYSSLFAELPPQPSSVLVLPHFTTTGPPEYISDSSGIISGLHLDTTRGDILKGIIEGAAFYLKQVVESLPETGIAIQQYRAVGGGSQSNAWVQLSADILGAPMVRPRVTEAGALGAAMMAGVGCGSFANYTQAVDVMVQLDQQFDPNPCLHQQYQERFLQYQEFAATAGGLSRL